MASRNPPGDGAGGRHTHRPLVHFTDLWVAVILLVFCGATYYVTTTFDQVSQLLAQNIPPQWFPRLLVWTIVVLTLIIPFEHLFLEKGREGLDADRSTRIEPMTIVTAVLLCLVVASIALIGTIFAIVVACVALPLLWGERRWKVLVPFAILFPAVVTILFTQVLKVYFEPGMFGLDLS